MQVGELVRLSIQIDWPSEEADYRLSEPSLVLEGLAIEGIGTASEAFQRQGRFWRRKTLRYELKAIEKGTGRILPFRVDYVDPARGIGGHLDVSRFEVRVSTIPHRNLAGTVLVLTLLLAGGLVWWGFSRYTSRSQRQPEPLKSTLEDRYEQKLCDLEEKPLSRKVGKNDIFESGSLFRSYVEEKHSVSGKWTTNQELVEEMKSRVSPEELKTLKRIFDKLDELRFSSRPPAEGEGRQLYLEIMGYVKGKKVIEASGP